MKVTRKTASSAAIPYMLPVLGYAMTLEGPFRPPPTARAEPFLKPREWWDALLAVPSPRILVSRTWIVFPARAH